MAYQLSVHKNQMKSQIKIFHDYAFYKYDGLTKCVCFSLLFTIAALYCRFMYDEELTKNFVFVILTIHTIGAFLELLIRAFSYNSDYINPESDAPRLLYRTAKDCIFEFVMILMVYITSIFLILFCAGLDYNFILDPIKVMYERFRSHTFQELFFSH